MLQTIVALSLRRRNFVLVLAAVLLGYGMYVTFHGEYDVFPDFVPPQAVVQTEAPGFSPEQVELLVTRVLENEINGLEDQESIRSESIQGLSIITVVFEQGADIFRSRQMLAERIAEASDGLPDGVRSPKITPLTSATMDLLKIGLVSDVLSPMDLRAFAEWTLKPRLLAVSGVAKASVFGGEVRELQIRILPDRLRAYDLAIEDVVDAGRRATGVRGAGFVENENQRIVIQTEGQLASPEDIGRVVVATRDGKTVLLRDVAVVAEGAEPKFGDSLVQGRPGVLITMSSQYGANTLEVTHGLDAALEDMKPVFQSRGVTLYPRLHRPATVIEHALANIGNSLVVGGVLVAVVLFVFLGHVRTALISLVAIPLSLLSSAVVLSHLGVSLNTMTIGGLAIAIGEVVDDAIIDVENIFRRLRIHRAERREGAIADVVLAASLEVRTAVVYATLIVALAFMPVLAMSGLEGSFFAPLGLAYVLAILASLVVALTVTPALALVFLAGGERSDREPNWQTRMKRQYRRVLVAISARPRTVIVTTLVLCALSLARLATLGGEFLPTFREGHFVLQVSTVPGTSLKEMLRIGRFISERLLDNDHVATVEQQVGRAELGEDPWGPQRSEFHVDLATGGDVDEVEVEEEIRALLATVPGIQYEVMTFLGDRISETISGETATVAITLFGDDLDVLDTKAGEIAGVLRSMPEAVDVQVKAPPGAPRVVVRLLPERLAQFGFRPVDVLDAVQTAYQGTIVAQTFSEARVENVSVILDESLRGDPDGIGALPVRGVDGVRLPLRELSEIYWTTGPSTILHDDTRRRQTITCNLRGGNVSSFVATARKLIAEKVELPAGVYTVFAGADEARARAQHQLLMNSAIAGVGVIMLLAVAFARWQNVALVVTNLPFALVGGVAAVSLGGLLAGSEATVTMGALVGFVTLFGITTRNSIMMLSHFRHLVSEEGHPWNLETAIRGATDRMTPIIMTALVTGLGLLPLALASGEAGHEIEGPMASVILGGLITSTALNLLVLPTLALRYGRFER